jgi:hypothetical protein
VVLLQVCEGGDWCGVSTLLANTTHWTELVNQCTIFQISKAPPKLALWTPVVHIWTFPQTTRKWQRWLTKVIHIFKLHFDYFNMSNKLLVKNAKQVVLSCNNGEKFLTKEGMWLLVNVCYNLVRTSWLQLALTCCESKTTFWLNQMLFHRKLLI